MWYAVGQKQLVAWENTTFIYAENIEEYESEPLRVVVEDMI
jgi:hypothetical protein